MKAGATLVFEQGTLPDLAKEFEKLGERIGEVLVTVPALDDVLQALKG